MTKEQNNKYRSLGQIAVANAWFDTVPSNGPPRYSFHMDVSFREERLGGQDGDPVRFRVALLQCEVVVALPTGEAKLIVDPRSIASDKVGGVVSRNREQLSAIGMEGSVTLKGGTTGFTGAVEGKASGSKSNTDTTVTNNESPPLLGQRSLTTDGKLSWIITRADGSGVLDQVLWDAKTQPRFALVDKRDPALREHEARTQLHPTIRVEIQCRSEDLRIEEIELTDPDERKSTILWKGNSKRKKAAEAFIKRELQREGLRAGNIHDPYGRIVVGDMMVSLIDDAQI